MPGWIEAGLGLANGIIKAWNDWKDSLRQKELRDEGAQQQRGASDAATLAALDSDRARDVNPALAEWVRNQYGIEIDPGTRGILSQSGKSAQNPAGRSE